MGCMHSLAWNTGLENWIDILISWFLPHRWLKAPKKTCTAVNSRKLQILTCSMYRILLQLNTRSISNGYHQQSIMAFKMICALFLYTVIVCIAMWPLICENRSCCLSNCVNYYLLSRQGIYVLEIWSQCSSGVHLFSDKV